MFRACWWGGLEYKQTQNKWTFFRLPAWTAAGLVITVFLASVVLLPLSQLANNTAGRAGGADYSLATSDSMPPQHLITFIAPFFYGTPLAEERESLFWETQTGFHEICGYVGILPLLLLFFAFLSRQKQEINSVFLRSETLFFYIVAIGGIFFSLGSYNPLYPLLYYGLPGWSYFRVPGRLVLLFILGVSVCSARGLVVWSHINPSQLKNSTIFKTVVALTVLFVFGVIILILSKPAIISYLREIEIERSLEALDYNASRAVIQQQLPEALFETRYSWMLGSCLTALVFLAGSGCALWLILRLKSNYKWILPFIVLLIDLLFFSHRFFPTQSHDTWRQEFYPETELVNFLKTNAGKWRIVCLDDAIGIPGLQFHPELRPNRLMHYRIESARGYDPLILKSYSRFVNSMYQRPEDMYQGGLLFFSPPESQAIEDFSLLNIKYVVTTKFLVQPFTRVWTEENSPLKIYENPTAKNRFFWRNSSKNQRVDTLIHSPAKIILKVFTKTENQLVWSQNYYPGWKVFLNDQPVRLERFRGVLMSVKVPPGEHEIRIQYLPLSFMLGGWITALTIISALIICAWERKKSLKK